MQHIFRTEQWIDHPRTEVFPFFADAFNLEQITPSKLRFEILTPPPIDIELGCIIDYRLRLLGIPFGWRTEITGWNPPLEFEDIQLRGPYRQWIHRHRFEEAGERTLMIDEVRFELPFSPVGDIAYPLVRAQLNRIFAFRAHAVRSHFGIGPAETRADTACGAKSGG